MKSQSLLICCFAVLVTIAADCAHSPLSSEYLRLDGDWLWIQSTVNLDYYEVQTPSSTGFHEGLSFSNNGSFARFFAVKPGVGVLIGLPSDSMYTSGSYVLSDRQGILVVEFDEHYNSTPIPPQKYSWQIGRLTSDTLVLGDAVHRYANSSTYIRIR